MKLHYGLIADDIILQKEISLDTLIKEVTPTEIIYDDISNKIGVIMNRIAGWKVPEYVVAWFDPKSDYITCTYGTTYPLGYDDVEYSPNWHDMEGFSRPKERKSGKVREAYNKLERFYELAYAE